MQDQALWLRIQDDPFLMSDGASLERRLLRHARLGKRRSGPLMIAYRRFLYLAAVAGPEVTPPPVLHRVWQVHARDHQAYQTGLVGRIIRRPMPDPFEMPVPASHPAHRRTRELYRQEFGIAPPPAVWPGPFGLVAGQALRVLVPGLAVLAGLLILSRDLPSALLAGVASLATLMVLDRLAPWVLRVRDKSLDLDFGSSGQEGSGVDLLNSGD